MTTNNEISQELLGLQSSLALQKPGYPYATPAGYFEELPGRMLLLVQALDAADASSDADAVSSSIPAHMAQASMFVPEGYFEQLPDNTLRHVIAGDQSAAEEVTSLSLLLGGLSKKMPYQVPPGYFNDATVAVESAPKIVTLTSRKWFRFAMAAMLIGVMVTFGLRFFNAQDKGSKLDQKMFASLNDMIEKEMKELNEVQKDDLTTIIAPGLSPEEPAVSINNVSNEVKDLLKDIPVDELQAFKEQTEDVQDILMTN